MDVQAILDDIDRQFAQARRARELFADIMQEDTPAATPERSASETTETIAPTPKRAKR